MLELTIRTKVIGYFNLVSGDGLSKAGLPEMTEYMA
jgi:hypothetical protein